MAKRSTRDYPLSSKALQAQPVPVTEEDITKWWLLPEDRMHEGTFATAMTIAGANSARRTNHALFMRMYDPLSSWVGGAFSAGGGSVWNSDIPTIQLNKVAQCVDAVGNKLFKDIPSPMACTEKGNGKLQRQAKKLTQALQGQLEASGFQYSCPQAGFSALKVGTAFLKAYYDSDGNFHSENVCINDIFIDQLDGRKQKPRQMHQVAPVDRGMLRAMFPDKEDLLTKSTLNSFSLYHGRTATDDVLVMESWHLPSSQDADDGKHVWSTEKGVLRVDPWPHQFFPFAVLRYKETDQGFYGTGIVHDLQRPQQHINMLLERIDTSIARTCKPVWLVPASAGVQLEHLDIPGARVSYEGPQPPTPITPLALSPEVYEQLMRELDWCDQTAGVNQLAINSQKPAGLNSGIGLETYHDIETERFSTFAKRFERFVIDYCKIIVALTRQMAKAQPGLLVKAKGSRFLKTIPWKDVDLPDEQFELDVFPVSELPKTPAGRRQELTNWIEAGWIDRTQAMQLLDMPDTDGYTQRITSVLDRLNLILEKILDGNGAESSYTKPDQYLLGSTDGPKIVLAVMNAEINLAYTNNEPEAVITLLDRFNNDCLSLSGLAQKTPAPTPVAPPGAASSPSATPPGPGGELAQGAPPPPPQAQLAA